MYASCRSNVLINLEVERNTVRVYLVPFIPASVKVCFQDLFSSRFCGDGRKRDTGNEVDFSLFAACFLICVILKSNVSAREVRAIL